MGLSFVEDGCDTLAPEPLRGLERAKGSAHSLDWSVEDGCDTLAPEPLRGAHHDDVVLDGESVHVVHHHMVWSRQKGRLAGQWGVLVQDYLK